MADQQLNIRLNAIDNASKAFSDIKNSIFSLKGALIGLGAGAIIKSIYDIGVVANDVRERLDETAKAGYGGAEAFNQLTKFAIDAKIPLVEVLKASNDLLRISKSPEELAKNLQIVSNISAKFGMDFGLTADQLAKAYTKGIDSAREFTTSGIRNLDEFNTFADTSIGRLPDLFEKVFGINGVFGRANENIKHGLSGTIISLGNSLDQFKIKTAQNFFGTLENQLGSLDKFILQNQKQIDLYAEQFGKVLAEALVISGKAIKFVADNFDLFVTAVKALIAIKFVNYLYDIAKAIEFIAVASNLVGKSSFIGLILKLTATIAGLGASYFVLNGNINETTNSIRDQAKEIDDWYNAYKTANDKIKDLDLAKVFNNIKEANNSSIQNIKDLTGKTLNLSQVIKDNLDKAFKDFSLGIARAIVLGEKLTVTFKKILQDLVIKFLANAIELGLRYAFKLILDEAEILLGLKKLAIDKERLDTIKEINKENGNSNGEKTIEQRSTDVLKKIFENLKQGFSDAFDYASSIFDNLGSYVNDIFTNISSSVGDIISSLSGSIGDIFSSIGSSLGDILGSVGNMFGGSGGGGGDFMSTLMDIGTLLFAAEGGAVSAGQPYVVGERGRELFIPSTNGTIVPNHDMGTGGSTSINFTINATDVRGVQELLINNRATITNLVNQALNQRGKSSIV